MAHQRNGASLSYRDFIAKKKQEEPVFELKVPSGFIWKVRKPDLTPWLIAGELPLDLVSETAKSIGHGKPVTDAEIAEKLTDEEQKQMLVFMREVVVETAVEPKITEKPEGPQDLHPRFVEWKDFEAIYFWAISGGGEIEALRKFREGQAKDANARPRRKKQRHAAK